MAKRPTADQSIVLVRIQQGQPVSDAAWASWDHGVTHDVMVFQWWQRGTHIECYRTIVVSPATTIGPGVYSTELYRVFPDGRVQQV